MHLRLSRLEQACNRLAVRTLGNLMPASSGVRPDWGSVPHRVLYLRYDHIGDMIVSTSLINAIAQSHPTITLDVLASPANAPVLAGNPNVSTVITWDKKLPGGYSRLVRDLRRARYDAVIDCGIMMTSSTAVLIMMMTGARHRIGIGGRINDRALTIRVPPSSTATHHIDRSAVLATAFGVDIDSMDWRPTLFFTDDEIRLAEEAWMRHQVSNASSRMCRMLVNISAGLPVRQWPEDQFVKLLSHVRTTVPELNVVLICAPAEIERGRSISERSGVPLVPTPQLRDALALVATSDFVVTPDTSIGHAASACRKPAVILFQKGTDVKWGRYGIPGRNISSADKTLATIPFEPVRDAVDELIRTIRTAGILRSD